MPASRIACLLPRAPKSVELALAALADAAAGFSPEVERAADAVYLEVGDLGRLFPIEAQLLQALEVAAEEVGSPAYVAVASDKGVARAAALGLWLARRDRGGAIVPAGRERAALAPLPIAALGPSKELLARIASWGVHTVGEFAALPRPAVATRLGVSGASLHRLAGGASGELLHKTPPLLELREEQELLDALDNLEPLLFVLRGLLDRLVARLRARSQACGDLVLRLGLSPRGEETRRIAVAAPTQKVAPLLALLQVALTREPPSATVEKLSLTAVPARPRPVQLDLFAPAGPAPERLATTLARLEALCGNGRVGQPVIPDTHSPGAAGLAAFAPPAPPQQSEPPPTLLLLSPRVFRPPRPVAVALAGETIGQIHLAAPGVGATEKGTARRSVRRVGGPYRLADVRGSRDYYDVELDGGDLLRLFHDLTADRWFLDAVYD